MRALCDGGDHAKATTEALRGYGPEVLGFLIATHRSEEEADEMFAEVAEGVWRNLPTFAWESTLRTWLYAIARNVSLSYRRNAGRRARRGERVGESRLDEVAAIVRTQTESFLKSAKRTRLEALRDELEPDDRMLLVLRVDRDLAWNDLALVMAKGELDSATVTKEAARLRKRFQILKERLRAAARKEGLVPPSRK